MAYNFDPEFGRQAAESMESFFANFNDSAVGLYKACMAGGENNNVASQIKDKFKDFEGKYNTALEALNTAKASIDAFTDFAEYRSKVQVNGDVKQIEADTVDPNKFSAAKDL